MIFRENYEDYEIDYLSKYAAKSKFTKGRKHQEEKCTVRTEFQRDRDRIIHSKAFRRLKHKTQVFLSPEGDHYRTRLTHTLEVSQISRTIARALKLNEDLTEAIALGHDLGHTPFGHCGEDQLNKIHEDGFKHNEQSLRVVDFLETRGNGKVGLNLTEEVRDGILNHSGKGVPFTMEGKIVKLCDRIAYINHDIDDALRAGILHEDLFEESFFEVIGKTHSSRINRLIIDVIENSSEKNDIRMSNEINDTFLELREYMFEHVYLNDEAKQEEKKARKIILSLYEFFSENENDIVKTFDKEVIKDYIAGMTDRYAVGVYKDIFLPKFWK